MNNQNKKILILYTSVGLGHKFIAENIGYHLTQAGYNVLLHDILKVQEGLLSKFGIWLHSFVNRRLPFVWRWLYFSELVNFVGRPLRVPTARANSENLYKIVEEFKPDMILSTQTTGSAATAALINQKKFSGTFVIAFSDYHLHKFWLYEEADFYLANTTDQKLEMIQLGIQENKIAVCGITLKPLTVVSQSDLRFKLNIPPSNKIMIFGSGSLGIGFDYNLLKQFLMKANVVPNLTTVVLCGKNTELLKRLISLNFNHILPLGFYDNPSELYQIADLLVSKPGGLTVAEALQAGCPILITHTLPGQEEPNYDYLLERELIYPKPQPLTAENLFNTAMEKLSAIQKSNTLESEKITQFGQEGKVLIESIENLFHNV